MTEDQETEEAITKFLRNLKVIHLALVGGLVFFGVVALRFRGRPVYSLPDKSDIFLYLVPILALAGYFWGIYIFRRMITNLEADRPVTQKLTRFQSASLVHYSLVETPTLIALYLYMQQPYVLYLAIAAFLIVYFYSIRPTRSRLQQYVPL